jgi:hypothetical protein
MAYDLPDSSQSLSPVVRDAPDLVSRDRLIDALRSLCAAQRSGTLFIITAENHAAQVVLREGSIVGLSHRLLRGLAALPPMRLFAAGRYRFVEEPVDRADPGLPSTVDVLALLTPEPSGSVAPQPMIPTPAMRQPPSAIRSLIEPDLTEILGPIAGLVCQEHLAHAPDLTSPEDVARMVDAIAKEIGDPAKEAHFRQRVLSKLKAAGS